MKTLLMYLLLACALFSQVFVEPPLDCFSTPLKVALDTVFSEFKSEYTSNLDLPSYAGVKETVTKEQGLETILKIILEPKKLTFTKDKKGVYHIIKKEGQSTLVVDPPLELKNTPVKEALATVFAKAKEITEEISAPGKKSSPIMIEPFSFVEPPIDFPNTPIKVALETVFLKAGVQYSIEVDLASYGNVTLTISEKQELETVLSLLLEPKKLEYVKDTSGIYHVSKKIELKSRPRATKLYAITFATAGGPPLVKSKIRGFLTPPLEFKSVSLFMAIGEVLERAGYSVSIIVTEPEDEKESIISYKLDKVIKIDELIDALIKDTGFEYTKDKDTYYFNKNNNLVTKTYTYTWTDAENIFKENKASRQLTEKLYYERKDDGSTAIEYKYSDYKDYDTFYAKIKDKLSPDAKIERKDDKITVRITDEAANIHALIRLLYDK